MTICNDLLDVMPDVVSGRRAWDEHEAAHLAACDECARTWDVTAAASQVGRDVPVNVAQVEAAVLRRLRSPQPVTGPRWHRVAMGFAAAAAAVVIFTSSRPDGQPVSLPPVAVADNAPMFFPELETLSAPQLEVILATVDEGADLDITPGGGLPRLGDLTDDQLEQLILSVEGE